jgi:hypothetical protein
MRFIERILSRRLHGIPDIDDFSSIVFRCFGVEIECNLGTILERSENCYRPCAADFSGSAHQCALVIHTTIPRLYLDAPCSFVDLPSPNNDIVVRSVSLLYLGSVLSPQGVLVPMSQRKTSFGVYSDPVEHLGKPKCEQESLADTYIALVGKKNRCALAGCAESTSLQRRVCVPGKQPIHFW